MAAHQYALMEVPKEHGKTEQIIMRAIWDLGRDPNLVIKIICQDDAQAMKRLAAIRGHISANHRVRAVFPHLRKSSTRDKWTDHELIVERSAVGEKEPSVEARGILGAGTGSRADLLLFDDVCDRRNTIDQPALREKVKENFFEVWMNLLPPEGTVRYIFTPWHQADLSASLKKNSEWALYSNLVDEDFNPVWEEEWSKEDLKKRCRTIGIRAFSRSFQGLVMSDDEKTFPHHVLIRVKDTILGNDFIDPAWPIVVGVDLAISKLIGSANTVLFPVAIDPKGVRYPLLDEMIRGKLSSTKTAFAIIEMYKRLHPLLFMVENNAYQASILEWIKVVSGPLVPARGYLTGGQKMDEFQGIPALATEMEMGAWKFLFNYPHDPDCNCIKCKCFTEFEEYPLGVYSDCVMAAWFADRAIALLPLDTRGSNLFTGDDDYEPLEDDYVVDSSESNLDAYDGFYEEDW